MIFFYKVVKTKNMIGKVVKLANIIWHEAYANNLPLKQINYMLNKFQSFSAIAEQITVDKYKYFLIYYEKKEIGFFSFKEDNEIFLSKVYILKEHRKKGYLKKIISYLTTKNKTIRLRVNKENINAITAYKNLGFLKVDNIKTSIGDNYFMDDYVMERKYTFKDLIKTEQEKQYFKILLDKINKEAKTNTIYPKEEDWFKALELTSLEDVLVVLIGQDPYFNEKEAMGLSFSVNEKVKIPPSLVNIYKEIENEYNKPMPNHGNLTGWAKQGVLLLNTIFTVSAKKPMSHKGFGWEIFTDEVIKLLQTKDFVVYLLLGNHAQKYEKKITNKNHAILKTSHPSPLASYRGFLGSNIFKQANELLKQNNKNEINWYLL